jgi:hypothetical protein
MTYCADIYIDVDTTACLLNITAQGVRKAVAEGRIPAEKINWGKRFVYQIPLSALPEELRIKYITRNEKVDSSGFDAVGYKHKYGKEGLDKLLKRLDAVKLMNAYKKSGQGGICDKRARVAKKIGISAARLSQLEKAYEEQGLKGIAENVKRSDKGIPRSMCLMAQDYVQTEICRATRPTAASVFERLKRTGKALEETACTEPVGLMSDSLFNVFLHSPTILVVGNKS